MGASPADVAVSEAAGPSSPCALDLGPSEVSGATLYGGSTAAKVSTEPEPDGVDALLADL